MIVQQLERAAPVTTAKRIAKPVEWGALHTAPPKPGRLVLRNLSKRFADSKHAAIEDIDLTCESGEFVVVVGPSGCGKSTLLNLVAGMIRCDRGDILLDDKPITEPGPDRAMVFQEHGLFPWLTAEQNIEFGLKMTGVPARQRRQLVDAALRMIHLPHSGHKLIHQLSGGMRQRVAIARALVLNPAVLLMDEPFASLDAQTRTLLHEQVQELWLQTGKTILFVTHSVGEAVRLADRIIVLHSNPGRIRREFKIALPHPRDFDSPEVGDLIRMVRKEIEDEVNRANAEQINGQ
ncbi:MAG: ABC transporter ATP-binding protein [Phycisphaerales bacterium]|nr:ABC transporter ATP-binding protein [Phycisphaerales bacterium]MCI0630665.1 ABC transporter ATP-binding protein [Phycisphaerales bacterium]MCI0675585.1 ABC transporter ATP-binding protein [Phycisphaerales bacterium]